MMLPSMLNNVSTVSGSNFMRSVKYFISSCSSSLRGSNAYKIVSIGAVFTEIIKIYYANKSWTIKITIFGKLKYMKIRKIDKKWK